MFPTTTIDLSEASPTISLPAGSPAGLYQINLQILGDNSVNADATLTFTPASSLIQCALVCDNADSVNPTTTFGGVVTGLQKMLGTAVITTPMLTTSTVIATFKKATDITDWSGKAVISYLGPIS